MARRYISQLQSIEVGAIFGICAALSFALMSVFVKQIGHSLPTSILVFFRFGMGFVLLAPLIILDKNFSFKVPQPMRYIIRILAALATFYCVFYTLKYLSLTDVLLLNNTAPLFVPLIALYMLGAQIPEKAWIGIILGAIGIVFIINPLTGVFNLASLIALASGFLAAIAIVQIRLMSKTCTVKQMLFYYFLISTVVSGIIASTKWRFPHDWKTWFLLLGVGFFGTLFQVFATLSYVTAPVRLMSSLMFLIVVFGAIFDWLIWDNAPQSLTLIGASLIIIGAIITVYFGQKEITIQKYKWE